MLGSLIRYLKAMRIVMFQLSGFYYITYLGLFGAAGRSQPLSLEKASP